MITSTPPGPPVAGVAYRYKVLAQDAQGDPITFGLSGPPTGLTIDSSTGLVSWTPTTAQLGPVSVIVSASDASGGESVQKFTLTVVAAATSPAIPPRDHFHAPQVGPDRRPVCLPGDRLRARRCRPDVQPGHRPGGA